MRHKEENLSVSEQRQKEKAKVSRRKYYNRRDNASIEKPIKPIVKPAAIENEDLIGIDLRRVRKLADIERDT